MPDLKARLLEHLNDGKKLVEFPGIKSLTSLDSIQDEMNLVTVPYDRTAHLLERVKVSIRQEGIVGVFGHDNGIYRPVYDLLYNFRKEEFELMQAQIISSMGLITCALIEQGRVYQLE